MCNTAVSRDCYIVLETVGDILKSHMFVIEYTLTIQTKGMNISYELIVNISYDLCVFFSVT